MKTCRTYEKPDFTVMRFAPSDNVASCDPETVYNQVTIPCLVTSSHVIFYSNCDSNYSDLTIVTITSEQASSLHFSSNVQAVEYLYALGTSGSASGGNSGSYTLTAGQYLVWSDGSLPHAGYITTDITSVVNSSL